MTESYYVFEKNRNDFGRMACMGTRNRFLTRVSSPYIGNPLELSSYPAPHNLKLMVASRIPTEGNRGEKKEKW